MRFADPALLLLLVLLPLVFWLGIRTGGRVRFSSFEVLKRLRHPATINARGVLISFRILAMFFIILALARPQSGRVYSERLSEGVDIFLVLDTSGSMQAMDFKINDEPVTRVEVVKKVVGEFIDKRSSDRMGMVVFAEEAFTQCPLTHDHNILLEFLKNVKSGMAGDSTAIGSAIGIAVARMKDLKAKSKVIVLLTDGQNNAGQMTPLKAAELAQSLNIKIYTIGVGTRGKAPFLVDTVFGKQVIYQESDLDEDTLKQIADLTGGKYYRATQTQELEQIYSEIDKLEKTEAKIKEYHEYNELYLPILLVALCLIIVEILLAGTRLRILP